MTTTSQTWTEEMVTAAGAQIQVVKGGRGAPRLFLHDEMGHAAWLRAHEALALKYTVTIPSHPGYGRSDQLDWLMTVRDMAVWYLQALDDLKLGPVSVVGCSLGGWLAAEMAAMCPHRFDKLVLIAPPGIKPPEGEIYDMFLVTAQQFIDHGFLHADTTAEYQELYPAEVSPEERERREVAREQSCRLTWRPYMHDMALPYLLRGVQTPTLLIWGKEDAVVPVSAGHAYEQALPNARLVTLDNAGHRVEVEQAEEVVTLIEDFLKE